MPGIEIKGQSKRANYRHGGRTGLEKGGTLDIPLIKKFKPKKGLTREKIEVPLQNLKDRKKLKMRCG
tara:strand:+ start:64 stop:264 length:201 start_codon:yes stop_codon:yes gene_type:complete